MATVKQLVKFFTIRVVKRENLSLAACLLVALSVRIWSIGFGLPHRYHVDEKSTILSVLHLGQGNFQITYPLLSPNLLDFLYLALFTMLLLWYLVTGRVASLAEFAQQYRSDPTDFYLLA